MSHAANLFSASELPQVAARARVEYAWRVSEDARARPWWDVVVVTASSARQAQRYNDEIQRRRERGRIPSGVHYLTVPDLDDKRIGSGGATLNVLCALVEAGVMPADADAARAWWTEQRVLIIHSGGDSRRLPQYSLAGKLFSALPVRTPFGEASTVFDEMLALSAAWAPCMPCGLLVTSGDVILTFDAQQVNWARTGVCGVAMRQPVSTGSRHGVFVVGDDGRVYSFLQRATAEEMRAAGGLLDEDHVALDTGLLHFDVPTVARLSALAGDWCAACAVGGSGSGHIVEIDLYEHFAKALTGQWAPGPDTPPILHRLAETLNDVPFWCDLVDGDFTHIGTTALFRQLMTDEGTFSWLYDAQQRLGAAAPAGVHSAGVIVDSIIAPGSDLGPRSLVIECDMSEPLRVGHGAIAHGLTSETGLTEVPADTVAHQIPVVRSDGTKGTVVRVYGVPDDPKASLASGTATWFGRPLLEMLAFLGIEADAVWDELDAAQRSLWNARLFPLGTPEAAGRYAAWLLGQTDEDLSSDWVEATRLSLSSSTQCADDGAIATSMAERRHLRGQHTALALTESDSDVRPVIAGAPSPAALARVGEALLAQAQAPSHESLTKAASLLYQASRFLTHAGLPMKAEHARAAAFLRVHDAVRAGVEPYDWRADTARWQHDRVVVSAPARLDLGGGWSDTPPFCLDWGGTVLNAAVSIRDGYPVTTTFQRLDEPVIRCVSGRDQTTETFSTAAEILAPLAPGCPFIIPRGALQMSGLVRPDEPLAATLTRLGGGLEVRTDVTLLTGTGLGISSIIGATMLRALAQMLDLPLTDLELSDQVMCLEQQMTTGGGWQDQAGGIFPGLKLVRTGPGLRQRLRVEPLAWDDTRRAEFAERLVLYDTGIRRVAKGLLSQVVASYLARETVTVQVLHSIKTLAEEMRYAVQEGEWSYLGQLLERHWESVARMTPYVTNAPINSILHAARPYTVGAKLAGAGGGGFLILVTRDPDATAALRHRLAEGDLPGAVCEYALAEDGLRIQTG